MLSQPGQFGGDPRRRQDKIHATGSDRTVRHARIFGGLFILGESDPAGRLDGP